MCKYDIKSQIEIVRDSYKKIKISNRNIKSKMVQNCMLSAVAMFSLKFPSLLQFDQGQEEKEIQYNLKSLYGVDQAPSDTYMREVLDDIDPKEARRGFKVLFRELQTGKKLEKFQILDGRYLVSIDGTQYFSSTEVHCEQCCEKHHRDGKITYHHNLLGVAIVKPGLNMVIPFCPEPILKQDGETKNDCEQNALSRLIRHLRREHPHLKMMLALDGLYSKAPTIRELNDLKFNYIIGAKSTDHQYLFKQVEKSKLTEVFKYKDSDGITHRYRYINGVALNQTNTDVKVNFLEYIELKDGKKQKYFSWVTDIDITKNNLQELMRAGRARWKIENETFNTLKNQGYHLEHNFGHGKKNLSTIFSFMMMLAFLIDQIQLIGSVKFQKALEKAKSKTRLWFKMRSYFCNFLINSWDDLFLSISNQPVPTQLIPNTS
jgi:hypothetical protein